MTRQQFLVTIGMSIVSLFGFSTIIGILTGDSKTNHDSAPSGYGGQKYGQ